MGNRKVKLLDDVPPNGDENHPGIRLYKGETITFIGTDLVEWLYVENEQGLRGWLYIPAEDSIYADALFDGLINYDRR